MSYLLDVNVLIALLDQEHVFHDRAADWFEEHAPLGWATCPHTENGVVRILGSPRYPSGPATPSVAATLLHGLIAYPGHEFWADDISILTCPLVDSSALGNAAHLTDTYLLALALHRHGKLATFDRRLSPSAVVDGTQALQVIA